MKKRTKKILLLRAWSLGSHACPWQKVFASVFKKERLLVLACLPYGSAYACSITKAAVLPVTLWQDKLIVPVTIEGTPERMAVDTGASTTVLAEATAASLNIPRDFDHTADTEGVGGADSHLYIGEVRHLGLDRMMVNGGNFPIADFRMRMPDGAQVAGLLGADILSRFDVEIDVGARTLVFWRVQGCSTVQPGWQGGYVSLPMAMNEIRHVSLPVRVDDTMLQVTLDTGAPGFVLTRRAAGRAGATPDILDQDRPIGGSGVNERSFEARLHIFRRVVMGDQIFGDVPAAVVENSRLHEYDGLLGLMFLKRSRVWLSYSTGMFFSQAE